MIDETTWRTMEEALPTLVQAALERPVPPDVAERQLAEALALARLADRLASEPPERALPLLDEALRAATRGERLGEHPAGRALLERLRERLCELLRAGQPLAGAVETALREFFDELPKLLGALAAGAVVPGLAKLLLAALVTYLVTELYQAVTTGACGPLPVPPSPLPPQPEPVSGA